jgi:hypothetical protein
VGAVAEVLTTKSRVWRIIEADMLLSRGRRLLLAGFAAIGLVVTHELAFMLAMPDPHDRLELLAATGHSYWNLAVIACFGLFVWACISYLATHRRTGPQPRTAFVGVWARLAIAQVAGFAALETVERLGAHHGLTNVLVEPAVVLGAVLALVLAAVVAGLFVAFTEVVDRLMTGARTAPRSNGFVWSPTTTSDPPRPVPGRGTRTLRGPPLGASSIAY